MLSNCILSMSTTFPLLLLPPVSLSAFSILASLISPFLSAAVLWLGVFYIPCHRHVSVLCVCACVKWRWKKIYLLHRFHNAKDFMPGRKSIRMWLDCPFARSICRCFSCISLRAQCPYFCVVSQHCCICQESINVEAMSLPLPWVDWFAVNEWAHEREGIVGHASLDGGGSFKAPVEQKKERGDPERA